MSVAQRRCMLRSLVEMQVDAVLERPEGAAIHQPRAAPWELMFRKNASPDRASFVSTGSRVAPFQGWEPCDSIPQGNALGYRIAAPLGRCCDLQRAAGYAAGLG